MKLKITTDSGFDHEYDIDEDSATEVGERGELIRLRMERNTMTERFAAMVHDKQVLESANKACADEISSLRENLKAVCVVQRGWEKRCGELEQDLRDAQERIHEQDVTIAKYDDENLKLRRVLGVHEIPLSIMDQADSVYAEARGIGKAFRCWAGIIHDNAVEHGWWAKTDADAGESCADGDRPLPEILMLCVTELAEAMEEYRNGKPMSYEDENGKPEGIAVEMIDCIIRILDWCGKEGIDVDGLLAKKHEYNKGRPYRHGGKKA